MFVRAALLLAGLFMFGAASPALAHDSTPAASPVTREPDIQMVLEEHADRITNIDLGDTGPSVGDLIVWGPNALYDAENATDTGATTQGICTAITNTSDCVLTETILFADGSTLELQGISEPGEPVESIRTIVAGSGEYLGAKGTVTVQPTADLTVWTKTFEIWIEG